MFRRQFGVEILPAGLPRVNWEGAGNSKVTFYFPFLSPGLVFA
jgi:hypothetical protein